VDASRSERPPPGAEAETPGWLRAILELRPSERLAALGILICLAATLLPWYRAPVDNLGKSAWGDPGFTLAALILTLAAALMLLMRVGGGHRPPLPLHEGTLLAVAGVWSAAIVVFAIFDRPEFQLGGFSREYGLGYGIFVALGGAGLLAVAGGRIRRVEIARERSAPPAD
jgi:hypothetical protein